MAPKPSNSAFGTALTDRQRRELLTTLASFDEPVGLRTLVRELLPGVTGTTDADADEPPHHRLATMLHHCYLPRLADAGVVAYDAAERTVALDDPLFERAGVAGGAVGTNSLAGPSCPDDRRRSRRRRVVDEVERLGRAVAVSELAARLVTREETEPWTTSDDAHRDLTVALYHVDLPLLDDEGRLAFDAATESVATERSDLPGATTSDGPRST